MSHFARVRDGVVQEVIVAEQELIFLLKLTFFTVVTTPRTVTLSSLLHW